MLDELTKALGPWPLLQLLFGLSILAAGIWAIVRGARGKSEVVSIDDKRAEWAAYEQLRNIEDNSFKTVDLLKRANDIGEQQLAAFNRLFDTRWNKQQ